MSAIESDSIIICKREYIKDIFARDQRYITNPVLARTTKLDITFFIEELPLNPGLQSLFPWLSQIAGNYEEYEWKSLTFHYEPTLTIIGTGGSGSYGTIAMTTNFNVDAEKFTSKQAMMDNKPMDSGQPSQSISHTINIQKEDSMDNNRHRKYIRTQALPPDQDATDYDYANFMFALCNIPTTFYNERLGELWVDYEIILSKPKVQDIVTINQGQDLYVTGQQNVPPSWPLGSTTGFLSGWYNSLGTTLVLAENRIYICFQPTTSLAVEVKFIINVNPLTTYFLSNGTSYINACNIIGSTSSFIEDIYGAGIRAPATVPSQRTAKTYQAWGSPQAAVGTYTYTVHVKIEEPIPGGQPYEIVELVIDPVNMDGAKEIWQAALYVQEYNATLSPGANGFGTNTGIAMVNSVGKIFTVGVDPLVPFTVGTAAEQQRRLEEGQDPVDVEVELESYEHFCSTNDEDDRPLTQTPTQSDDESDANSERSDKRDTETKRKKKRFKMFRASS